MAEIINRWPPSDLMTNATITRDLLAVGVGMLRGRGGSWFLGFLVSEFIGFVVSCIRMLLVSWFLYFQRCLLPWFRGFKVSWFQNMSVLKFIGFLFLLFSGRFLSNVQDVQEALRRLFRICRGRLFQSVQKIPIYNILGIPKQLCSEHDLGIVLDNLRIRLG